MRFNIWKDYKYMDLPDVLSFIVDNRGKTVPTDEKGTHILIATNCIRNENLYPSYEKIRFLNEDTYRNWFRSHPIPGDIIFVNKGTPGRVCMVPDPVDFCIAQDMMAFRANSEIVYNKYLFAVLRSSRIQNQIALTTVGDVIPHFKKQHLHEIKIPIPPMEIQKVIGDYYFAFCNKIVVNSKINRNLQEQLEAVYREKFTRDPNGRLSDLCSFSRNKIEVDKLTEKTYFSTENMLPNKAGFVAASSLPSTDKTVACSKGNILISNIRPYFKKIVYCQTEGGCSADVLCFVAKKAKWSSYLYSILFSDKFFEYMVVGSKGTKMPRGDKQQIMRYPVYIPSEAEVSGFISVADNILNLIYKNQVESDELVQLRDVLLPQLISGELDISDLEI